MNKPTAEDYLRTEESNGLRHEYVDGEIYAMAGAGEAHNLIALNVAAGLRNLVRGGPCRVFIADMKLRVAEWNAFYYPDVMVVCNPADNHTHYKEQPGTVIEVMSPTTESIDRREKLLAYRTLPSLQEYVLIAQDRRHMEVYRKDANGILQHEVLAAGQPLWLETVSVSLTQDAVYEDVKLVPNLPKNALDIA
ncbi:MAG: Uma2 family endonuclease [Rhodoferax sp.]|nr:Uma2 family endonuclease [Rhodoferax sp.]